MNNTIKIYSVTSEQNVAEALAEITIDCVEEGSAVGFMHPLSKEKAVNFWKEILASASQGERIVLVAEDTLTHTLVGTVQSIFAPAENRTYWADIAKMQVLRRARKMGVGTALMQAIEAASRSAGKTHLFLDTVTNGDGERLYEKLGWQRCGKIPEFAYWPQGNCSCDVTLFYKILK